MVYPLQTTTGTAEQIEVVMNHEQVRKCWNQNAPVWTSLARAGYDAYRDYFNTPAFFQLLPAIDSLVGLDIGCGEGYNTRLLARRGAHVAAVDISELFIQYAQEFEAEEPFGIGYSVASAVALPFGNATFDFVVAFMSFMDIPETECVIAEAHRVLKRGGFLQFSIEHPCFATPHRRNLRNQQGLTYGIEVGDYFRNLQGRIAEWTFGAVPREMRAGLQRFQTPRFTRTISQWLNLLLDTGFVLERIEEPRPDDETVRVRPDLQDAQVVAYFLHIRARKPN
jgi:SAM-dependent methyltransferase